MKTKDIEKIYSIEVIDETYESNLGGQDSDDEWSRDSYSTSHSIQGFKVVPGTKYSDIPLDYEPAYGELYYLLYAVYSTGDSFGHDPGNSIEFIWLYNKDQVHIAQENLHRIEKSQRAENGQVSLLGPDGKTEYKIYAPWHGYFESLDFVEIEAIQRMP
jgi:hypothetical protein